MGTRNKEPPLMTSPKIAIGIDLGSRKCCVGLVCDGKVEILENERGKKTTPSYVAFTEAERLVGESALDQVALNPTNTVFGAKRLLGRKGETPETIMGLAKHLPYDVTKENGGVRIKVAYKGKEKKLSPEQIAAMLLSQMKNIAQKHMGYPVLKAVIAVPANFTNAQRKALKDAGTIAGLTVLGLINETTAAAVAYQDGKTFVKKQNVLVVDIGGEAFNAAVVEVQDASVEAKAICGTTNLSGGELDRFLVEHLAGRFTKLNKVDVKENKKAFERLKLACQKAKHTLTLLPETVVQVDCLVGERDFSDTIKRSQLNKKILPAAQETIKKVLHNVLSDANLSPAEIDEVVLIGGTTRVPALQEALVKFFDGKPLNKTVNPDEAVAYGAALQAAILVGNNSVAEVRVTDIVKNPVDYSERFRKQKPFVPMKTIEIPRVGSSSVVYRERIGRKNKSIVEHVVDSLGVYYPMGNREALKNQTKTHVDVMKVNRYLTDEEIREMEKIVKFFNDEDLNYNRVLSAVSVLEALCFKVKDKLPPLKNSERDASDGRVSKRTKALTNCEECLEWLQQNEIACAETYLKKTQILQNLFTAAETEMMAESVDVPGYTKDSNESCHVKKAETSESVLSNVQISDLLGVQAGHDGTLAKEVAVIEAKYSNPRTSDELERPLNEINEQESNASSHFNEESVPAIAGDSPLHYTLEEKNATKLGGAPTAESFNPWRANSKHTANDEVETQMETVPDASAGMDLDGGTVAAEGGAPQPQDTRASDEEASKPLEVSAADDEAAKPQDVTAVDDEAAKPQDVTAVDGEVAKLQDVTAIDDEAAKPLEGTAVDDEAAKPQEVSAVDDETEKPQDVTAVDDEAVKPLEVTAVDDEAAKPQEVSAVDNETEKPQEVTAVDDEAAKQQETIVAANGTAKQQETMVALNGAAKQQETTVALNGAAKQQETMVALNGAAKQQETTVAANGTAKQQETMVALNGAAKQQETTVAADRTAEQQETMVALNGAAKQQETMVALNGAAKQQETTVAANGTAKQQETMVALNRVAKQQETMVALDEAAKQQETVVALDGAAKQQETMVALNGAAKQQETTVAADRTAEQQETMVALNGAAKQQETTIAADRTAEQQETMVALNGAAKQQETTVAANGTAKQQETMVALHGAAKQQEAMVALNGAAKQQETMVALNGAAKQQETTVAADRTAEQQETKVALNGAAKQQETTIAADRTAEQQETMVALNGPAKQQKTIVAANGAEKQRETTVAADGTAEQQESLAATNEVSKQQDNLAVKNGTPWLQQMLLASKESYSQLDENRLVQGNGAAKQQETMVALNGAAKQQETTVAANGTAKQQETMVALNGAAKQQETTVAADRTAEQQETMVALNGTAKQQETMVALNGAAKQQETTVAANGTAKQQETMVALNRVAKQQETMVALDEAAKQQETVVALDGAAKQQETMVALNGAAKQQETTVAADRTAEQQETMVALNGAAKQQETTIAADRTAEQQETMVALNGAAKQQETTVAANGTAKQQETMVALHGAAKQQEAMVALNGAAKQQETMVALNGAAKQQETTVAADRTAEQQETKVALNGAAKQQETTIAADRTAEQQETMVALNGPAKQQKTIVAANGAEKQRETTVAADGTAEQQESLAATNEVSKQQDNLAVKNGTPWLQQMLLASKESYSQLDENRLVQGNYHTENSPLKLCPSSSNLDSLVEREYLSEAGLLQSQLTNGTTDEYSIGTSIRGLATAVTPDESIDGAGHQGEQQLDQQEQIGTGQQGQMQRDELSQGAYEQASSHNPTALDTQSQNGLQQINGNGKLEILSDDVHQHRVSPVANADSVQISRTDKEFKEENKDYNNPQKQNGSNVSEHQRRSPDHNTIPRNRRGASGRGGQLFHSIRGYTNGRHPQPQTVTPRRGGSAGPQRFNDRGHPRVEEDNYYQQRTFSNSRGRGRGMGRGSMNGWSPHPVYEHREIDAQRSHFYDEFFQFWQEVNNEYRTRSFPNNCFYCKLSLRGIDEFLIMRNEFMKFINRHPPWCSVHEYEVKRLFSARRN